MDTTQRIRTASRRLGYLMTALLILIPTTNAAGWLFLNAMDSGVFVNAGNPDASGVLEVCPLLPEEVLADVLGNQPHGPLPLSARFMALAASMLPAGVLMYGVLVLRRLFRLYESGRIFTPDNVRCYRRLAATLFWWTGALIVYRPLLSLALTLHNPPGGRIISISLGSPDLTALVVGAVLWVVAWVMEEGSALREEQEFTV